MYRKDKRGPGNRNIEATNTYRNKYTYRLLLGASTAQSPRRHMRGRATVFFRAPTPCSKRAPVVMLFYKHSY